MWRWAFAWVVAGCLALLLGTAAVAHPMPESQVWLDTTPDGLTVTLKLPLDRLEVGFGQPLADTPAADLLARHGPALARYLLAHVGARSADGRTGWQAQPPRLQLEGSAPAAELHATLTLRAPAGSDPRTATLLCDVITHELRTHRIRVFLRHDWAAGRLERDGVPLLLGDLGHDRATLALALPEASAGAGWQTLLIDGARHIAEGTDHLLFLLVLMLAAPLLRTPDGRDWGDARAPRDAVRQPVRVVTGFTLGHSLTLALGSTGIVRVPVQPVEVLVAASIVVGAWHAWRPLRFGSEVGMAAGFGLVHGLAFSASLNGAGLTVWQHAQALLAFNLGIEAVQVLLALLVMPGLLWLAHHRPEGYAGLRRITAGAAAALALFWSLQRVGLF